MLLYYCGLCAPTPLYLSIPFPFLPRSPSLTMSQAIKSSSVLHRLEACPTWNIPGLNLSVQGHSRSAERTGFWIPELKLLLDGGVTTFHFPAAILLSHSHTDHSYALPLIMCGNFPSKPQLFCPREGRFLKCVSAGQSIRISSLPQHQTCLYTCTVDRCTYYVFCGHFLYNCI